MTNRRGQASRAALLAVAMDVFAVKRFEEVALAEITQAAGAAAGSVNYHFGSKRGLYLEVLEASSALFWGRLGELTGPAADRLVGGIEIFLDLAEQQSGPFLTLVVNTPDEEIGALKERNRDTLVTVLVAELTGAGPTPVLRAALTGCLAFIEGTVAHWIRNPQATRTQIRDLLVAQVHATVLSAVQLDPEIALSPGAARALLGHPGSPHHTAAAIPPAGEPTTEEAAP
jgi:AcrR family transcriptional regulator